MNRSNPHPRRRRRVMAGLLAAGLAAVAVAAPVTVQQDVDVKSDKNPLADPVETVSSGGTLEKLSVDGSWVRVRTAAGKEGYVSADELPGSTDVSNVSGNTAVSGSVAAAAGRGLQQDAEKYAASKNLNKAGVNQMIAWGNAVKDRDLRDFAKAGHVGPSKFRK